MDYPLTLKHLHRSPLPLDRVPDHLVAQIILKQSVASIFNFPHTNSRYAYLVEAALSRNLNVARIQRILIKIDKKKLIEVIGGWSTEGGFPFPPSAFKNSNGDTSLHQWIWKIRYEASLFVAYNRLNKDQIFKEDLQDSYYYIFDQWKDQQCRGPKSIALQDISGNLWKKILAKTSSIAAIQLAKTKSTVTAAFDSYVNSVPTIQFMIQAVSMVVQDRDRDYGATSGIVEMNLRNRVIRYYQKPLFVNSLKTYLWSPRVPEYRVRPIEAIIEKIKDKQKKCQEENWKTHKLLDHPVIRKYDPCVNLELIPKYLT